MSGTITREQALEITASIKASEANQDYHIALFEDHARKQKIKYDAYIKAGFDDAQALYLIKDKL